jgi:hypothetical protein
MFFPRHRPARTLTDLFELRKERDAELAEKRRVFGERALARAKARYDAHPGEPVVWNLMLISGSGDWGAFGAGFLKGWSTCCRGHSANPSLTWSPGSAPARSSRPSLFLAMTSQSNPF